MGVATAIGLGLAGAGAFASASATKKAANKAANVAQETSAENNALTREIYGQNKEMLAPYVARGGVAGDTLNALLGLAPTTQPTQSLPTQQPNAMAPFDGFGGQQFMDIPGVGQIPLPGIMGGYGGGTFNTDGTQATPVQTAPQTPAVTPEMARNSFQDYIRNSDYAFQFGEGANRVNSGYAGAGTLKSGAAMKALEDFRQNLQQGYRGEYTGLLGRQQQVGLGGASALAGVGQTFVDTVTANNNNASSVAANSALIRGGNNPLAAAAGMIGGGLFQYGMRK